MVKLLPVFALALAAGALPSQTAQPLDSAAVHQHRRAACPYSLAVYFGNGCFWHTQYDFFLVERSNLAPFGRSLGDVTGRVGYGGGVGSGPNGQVCYVHGQGAEANPSPPNTNYEDAQKNYVSFQAEIRQLIRELKQQIALGAPFGVDLLLPAVGGEARATNYDYTHGQLADLIDVVVEEGARLFVTAVGVPPVWVVERLHAAGILVMNMVGSPKHVAKALAVGVDAVCAQGSEAGGHTGDVSTLVLVPQCVDLCKGHTSPLHGGPVMVVGALY